jgi:hypothetical protein
VAMAVAVLGAGGAAELLASAQVHPRLTIKVNRKVGHDKFKGRVDAKDPVCERRRKVKLIVRKPNKDKRKVGTPKTNRKGKWTFIPRSGGGYYADEDVRYADPGEYRAKVGEKRAGGVICTAAKSSPIHVG